MEITLIKHTQDFAEIYVDIPYLTLDDVQFLFYKGYEVIVHLGQKTKKGNWFCADTVVGNTFWVRKVK